MADVVVRLKGADMVVVWALVVSNGGFLVAPTSKSWWSVRDPLARRFSAMEDSRVDGNVGFSHTHEPAFTSYILPSYLFSEHITELA